MAYDNSPNADSTDRRPPLVWCDTEDDSDVSVHLGNARSIAGMLIAVDGHHNLDTGVHPELWTNAMLGFPQSEENRGEEESLQRRTDCIDIARS